jgi:hypothetical protein
MVSIICLGIIALSGCKKGPEKVSQPEKETAPVATLSPAEVKALPTVTLTGTKILDNIIESAVRVEITTSGAFGSNVVRKAGPERIVVILHNAKKGQAPPGIDVNNGTINHVVIDQLNVGKGTAVRITIGLEHKTDYVVTPAANGLIIDVRKKS